MGVAGGGTEWIVRSHPQFRLLVPTSLPTLWILPALLAFGSILFLRLVPDGSLRIGVIAGSGTLLALIVLSQYCSINPSDSRFGPARFVLHVTTYVVAAGFYISIFQRGMNNLYTAPAIGFVSLLLALDLFKASAGNSAKAWFYTTVIALILTEIALAFGFLPLGYLTAGVVSLLAFYLFTGIVLHHFAHRLTRGTVGEFTVVALIGLSFLYIWGPH